MKNFILEILKRLTSTILVSLLLFTASYCLITGEFPPKIENMKRGIVNLHKQIQQVRKIQEARLKAALVAQETNRQETAPQEATEPYDQQALLRKINDLEKRVMRLESLQL